MKLGVIVEGHGDATAVPLLLRRIAVDLQFPDPLEIARPFRLPRGKILKGPELQRCVEIVARQVGSSQPILVLLDADEDCPAEIGPRLAALAAAQRSDRSLAVILAKREFESWLVAGASSLAGHRGLPDALPYSQDPEGLRDPKGWLGEKLPNGYSETIDQPALAACLDWRLACRAASFAKLVRDLCRLLGIAPPPEAA
ncbi:MAG: DUF4276 family protein [Deltaproteobacteria bacterium]|nr:DUF4276 family protein [Deltaproteobacteria bacterium]